MGKKEQKTINRKLIDACYMGDIDHALNMLYIGADVNARDSVGWTPLTRASQNGYKEIALALIAQGADVNAMDNEGSTPLIWASLKGHTEIAAILQAEIDRLELTESLAKKTQGTQNAIQSI